MVDIQASNAVARPTHCDADTIRGSPGHGSSWLSGASSSIHFLSSLCFLLGERGVRTFGTHGTADGKKTAVAHAVTPQLVCGNVSPVGPALSSMTEAGVTLVLHLLDIHGGCSPGSHIPPGTKKAPCL